MNLINNIKTKNILDKFKDFDYVNYINIDKTEIQSSISDDFVKSFIKKNKNFENDFAKKMKLFWKLEFLGFFMILPVICIFIPISIIYVPNGIYYSYTIKALIGFSIFLCGFIICGFILVYYNFKFLSRTILNKITNRVENFKTFEMLFNEGKFKNFNDKTGPYEFQVILLLKGSGNFIRLARTGVMNKFRDDSPNLISCMYQCTKMLLYYFENLNK